MMIQPAFADVNCAPIYGGGQSCTSSNIAIQKRVLNPHTGAYVHDLGLVDNKFMPGDQVTFQITITNIGSATINDISVTDFLPDHMIFVTSNVPTYNGTSDPTFNVDSLLPGESKSILLTGKLDDAEQLGNTGSVCFLNKAKVVARNVSEANDSSQICVFHPQTFTAPTTTTTPATPSTGPSFLSSLLLPTTGAIGILIRQLEKHFSYQKGIKN